jgi:hypothetical protein
MPTGTHELRWVSGLSKQHSPPDCDLSRWHQVSQGSRVPQTQINPPPACAWLLQTTLQTVVRSSGPRSWCLLSFWSIPESQQTCWLGGMTENMADVGTCHSETREPSSLLQPMTSSPTEVLDWQLDFTAGKTTESTPDTGGGLPKPGTASCPCH